MLPKDLTHLAYTITPSLIMYIKNIASALIILVVGWLIAKLLKKIIFRRLDNLTDDRTLNLFLSSLIYWLIWLIVIIAFLSKLGVQTGSLIAVMGGLSLAVGLSLKNSLSNLASGLLLIFFKPFKDDDYVKIGSTSGTITDIEIMHTNLKTTENESVVIPNSKVLSSEIINYSKYPTRRINFTLDVNYECDLESVKTLLNELLAKDKRIHQKPTPKIALESLSGKSMTILIRAWTSRSSYSNVTWDLNEAIKKTFEEEKISLS